MNYYELYDAMVGNLHQVSESDCRLIPEIKKVIFNPPATVVFWEDGIKTVVKAHAEDFDPEKGLAMAISKRAIGNSGYYKEIKTFIK